MIIINGIAVTTWASKNVVNWHWESLAKFAIFILIPQQGHQRQRCIRVRRKRSKEGAFRRIVKAQSTVGSYARFWFSRTQDTRFLNWFVGIARSNMKQWCINYRCWTTKHIKLTDFRPIKQKTANTCRNISNKIRQIRGIGKSRLQEPTVGSGAQFQSTRTKDARFLNCFAGIEVMRPVNRLRNGPDSGTEGKTTEDQNILGLNFDRPLKKEGAPSRLRATFADGMDKRSTKYWICL